MMKPIPENASSSWRDRLRSSSGSSSSSASSSGSQSGSSSSEESDWERQVNANSGNVFYVNAFSDGEDKKQDAIAAPQSEPEAETEKKKSGKISRLVRRRESKRDRQSQQVPVDVSSDNDSSTYYGHNVKTFEAVFEAGIQLHEVNIRIKGRKRVVDPNRALLEQMMGIVPKVSLDPNSEVIEDVVIHDFIGLGPASKLASDDKLRIGDIVRLVNGHRVNLATIEQLLSTFPSSTKVKVTVERPPITVASSAASTTSENDHDGHFSGSVLYLTRDGVTEASPENADILYQFPLSDGSKAGNKRLLKARGIFATLAQAVPEVVGKAASVSTSTVVSVGIDARIVHAVTIADGDDDVFIFSMAEDEDVTSEDVRDLAEDVVKLLRFRYKSLRATFRPKKSTFEERFEELNRFFAELFERKRKNSGRECQWLVLPEEVRFSIDDALNQFESGDFRDYSPEFFANPREYDVLGSSLFHRGLVLANHLPEAAFGPLRLYCGLNGLLDLTRERSVHQIVAWTEVHFEPQKRTFLLLVGLGNQLLGVVLAQGAHTASLNAVVKPDPFYVDQALNTLDHLEDMGIPGVAQKWLTLPPNPDLVSVDKLYNGNDDHSSNNDNVFLLKRTVNYSSDVEDGDEEDESDGQSDEMQTAFREEIKTKNVNEEEDVVAYKVETLTTSPENTLFHYVHIDKSEGVILAPLKGFDSSPLHEEVVSNFRSACKVIKKSLKKSKCVEKGMLFHWSPAIPKAPILSYWVCGRRIDQNRECYVCYHESAPQDMIELAFRLAHGVHL